MKNEQIKKQELFTQVVQKAWEDPDFKKRLIANPIETIAEETGEKIQAPEGKTLVVIDQSEALKLQKESDKTYFIIPEQNQDDLELTEAELEAVSGGFTVVIHTDVDGNITDIEWQFTLI